MRKAIIGLAASAILMALALGTCMVINANAQDKDQAEQTQQYENLGEQLLTEFLTFHNEYRPSVLVKGCEQHPDWTFIGKKPVNGITWLMAKVSGQGVYSFGYVPRTVQPQVVTFIPFGQAYLGQSVDSALAGLVKDATDQFDRKPDMIAGNMIVYDLTDEIVSVIVVAPDGSYSIGTGFKKYIKLPELEEA